MFEETPGCEGREPKITRLGLRGRGKIAPRIAKGMSSVSRSHTFPYFAALPYETESEEYRLENLRKISDELYCAFSAEHWTRAIYWTQELRDWLSLKFDLPKEIRIRLVKVYYEVITAFGVDPRAHARFMSCFLELTKYGDHCIFSL